MSTQHVRPKSWESRARASFFCAMAICNYTRQIRTSSLAILSGSLPHTVGRRLDTFMGCSPHSRPIFLDIDWIPVFAYSVTSPAARPSMDTRCAANCADLYICLICLPCLPPQFGYGFKCRPPTLFIHLFRFHLIVPFSCSLFILTMTTRPSLVHHAFISRDLTELFYILYCICINTTCILLQASLCPYLQAFMARTSSHKICIWIIPYSFHCTLNNKVCHQFDLEYIYIT